MVDSVSDWRSIVHVFYSATPGGKPGTRAGAVKRLSSKAGPWHELLFVLESLRLIAVAGRMSVEESENLGSFEQRVTGIEIQTQVPGRR